MNADLERMTRKSLHEQAKQAGHTGISRYTKEQLIALLDGGLKDQTPPSSVTSAASARTAGEGDLEARTRKELVDLARSAGLTGLARATKADLVSLIQEKLAAQASGPVGSSERHPSAEREPAFSTADAIARESWDVARDVPVGPVRDHYSRDYVTLLVKDPFWLHAYWEVRAETLAETRARCNGGAKEVIRVHEEAGGSGNGSAAKCFDIEVVGGQRNWYIHSGKPGSAFYVEYGLLDSAGQFHAIARSATVATPRNTPSEVEDEEWMSLPGGFEQIYALSGGGRIGAGSLEIRELIERRFQEEIASGGISSFGSGGFPRQRERGFWLVLNAELVVYGATEPDAAVTLQGRPLQLRPDGTFTARFAFPDGEQEIPVEATSADGVETRTITVTVARETASSAVEKAGV